VACLHPPPPLPALTKHAPPLLLLLLQLFEVLLAVASNSRLCKLIQPALPELAYHALGYMQMTQEQVRPMPAAAVKADAASGPCWELTAWRVLAVSPPMGGVGCFGLLLSHAQGRAVG
jgi:hypothetical protein